MTRRTPIYSTAWGMRPYPDTKADGELLIRDLLDDYKGYVKEASEEEDMLLKALRDQETEYAEKLLEKDRKLTDMTHAHIEITSRMQEGLNKAHDLSRELAEMTKKYEEAQAMVEWQARNEIDQMDLVDHLSKKNRKLKKRLRAIREMTKC